MRLYKCLADGARSPFTGFRWPQATDGPGSWVAVDDELVPCRHGFHACRVEHLPHWLAAELWVIEVAGELLETADHVIARRARLICQVDEWRASGASAFAVDCGRLARAVAHTAAAPAPADRQGAAPDPNLRSMLDERAADAEGFSDQRRPAVTAYVAAVAAGQLASGGPLSGPAFERGFVDERARQAEWLRSHLDLESDRRRAGDETAT